MVTVYNYKILFTKGLPITLSTRPVQTQISSCQNDSLVHRH